MSTDPKTAAALKPVKEEMDKVGAVVQGETKVELRKSTCSNDECNLGNFFCDAMIHAVSSTNLLFLFTVIFYL